MRINGYDFYETFTDSSLNQDIDFQIQKELGIKLYNDLKDLSKYSFKWWVAGGAICSIYLEQSINDLDIYVENLDTIPLIENILKKHGWHDRSAPNCKMYTRDGHVIQIINRIVGPIESILAQFDWTVTMAAYNPVKNELIVCDEFFEGMENEILIYNTYAKYPILSLGRIAKYGRKGFNIPIREIFTIIFKIRQLNLADEKVILEQLRGIEAESENEIIEFVLELFGSD